MPAGITIPVLSFVDPNTLKLDPDPGYRYWSNLDLDPDPGLYYPFGKKKILLRTNGHLQKILIS